jgi:hypothetical protein
MLEKKNEYSSEGSLVFTNDNNFTLSSLPLSAKKKKE